MNHQKTSGVVGRSALVTGASSGLGRAAAFALARAGFDVAMIARSASDLERVAGDVAANSGRRALPLPVDLADNAAVLDATECAVAEFGGIDVLANVAGTDAPGPAEALPVSEWDRVLAVNLRAPFLLAKAVFPHMKRLGRGTIINVSSVAGKRGWANASAYCASKFGLTGLTQALAAEGKPHGIRACILYPGGMATAWGAWSHEERSNDAPMLPPAEALPPEQVADLIVWIAVAPPELVLNEAIISPLQESGWP